MARFVGKRVVVMLVTLLLLSAIIFVSAQVLPGDVGRNVLGPFASAEAVAEVNAQLGTDRPLTTQYASWVSGAVRGDFGTSYALRRPVGPMLFDALGRSAKLALLAFLLVVPLAIVAGLVAALKEGRVVDRTISLVGVSMTAIPDFVWAVVGIAVFGLGLNVLPVTAQPPQGAGALVQLQHLILPALCLVFVLFGYIMRMARAGAVESLRADYTRTAVLKGLPWRTVIRRHVVRNAMLPTIMVVATQLGYLFGGLVAIELIFNYPGIGQALFQAARQKDVPVLEGAVLLVGLVYLVATLLADIIHGILDPRVRRAA